MEDSFYRGKVGAREEEGESNVVKGYMRVDIGWERRKGAHGRQQEREKVYGTG